MFKVDQNYMRRYRDGSLDGRLDMSNHRISGLADPIDADDAVTRRYIASRFQALSDEVQDKKSKLDALQNLFGVENNQVLIRKYEIIGTDYHSLRELLDLRLCLENIHKILTIMNLLIYLCLKNIFSSI